MSNRIVEPLTLLRRWQASRPPRGRLSGSSCCCVCPRVFLKLGRASRVRLREAFGRAARTPLGDDRRLPEAGRGADRRDHNRRARNAHPCCSPRKRNGRGVGVRSLWSSPPFAPPAEPDERSNGLGTADCVELSNGPSPTSSHRHRNQHILDGATRRDRPRSTASTRYPDRLWRFADPAEASANTPVRRPPQRQMAAAVWRGRTQADCRTRPREPDQPDGFGGQVRSSPPPARGGAEWRRIPSWPRCTARDRARRPEIATRSSRPIRSDGRRLRLPRTDPRCRTQRPADQPAQRSRRT